MITIRAFPFTSAWLVFVTSLTFVVWVVWG